MTMEKDKWNWSNKRGGFAVTPPYNTPFIPKEKYFLNKAVDSFKASKGKSTKKVSIHQDHLHTVSEIAKFLNDAGVTPSLGGKIVAVIIKKGIDKLINGNHSQVPLISEYRNTKSETKLLERHLVRCLCGRKSTSSVLNVMKTQGMNKKLLYSTYRDDIKSTILDANVEENPVSSRSQYLQKFGFNQKLFVMLGTLSHITLGDYAKLYNLEYLKDSEFSPQVPYGLVISEQSTILLHNSDSFNGMMVKIHVCSFKAIGMTVKKLYRDTFNLSNNEQQSGKIPKVYQYGDRVISEQVYSMLCSSTATLMKSANFKNEVIISHTFQKRLDPGDVFDFRFKNQCGSGIRLDLLKAHLARFDSSGMNEPSDYFYIIEAFGYESECIEFATNNRYIGNSPGWLNIEFTKSLEYCIQNTTISSDYLKANINGDPDPAIKLYRRELGSKEFNVDISLIGRPGGTAKYGIMSYTTQYPVYAEDFPTPTNPTQNLYQSRVSPAINFDQDVENEYIDDENNVNLEQEQEEDYD